MKTSVNVMGIQAQNMLECIAATLKAVLRKGKENKNIQVISEEAGEEQSAVFTAQDAVFYEERLMQEIPEPNWTSGVIAHPKLLAEQAIRSANQKAQQPPTRRARVMGPIRQRNPMKNQAKAMLFTFPQVESKRPRDIRYVKNSLSPPRETVT
ncbi:hypothetical protein [Brevibacillus reuszeri]|uniref:hypothetical protein n=1 Tax=Brevibacillus reuszeri TaxID=54915 RepID=UPI000CCC5F2F|nr:hypothetical protein [Brevibacillus reuszeri]